MSKSRAKQVHSLSIHHLKYAIEFLERGNVKRALQRIGWAITHVNIKAR